MIAKCKNCKTNCKGKTFEERLLCSNSEPIKCRQTRLPPDPAPQERWKGSRFVSNKY